MATVIELDAFTLIIPYYDQPGMLRRQAAEWAGYPNAVRVLVVDDGSPRFPAAEVLAGIPHRAAVYRVGVDIPWNRNGARNLGARVAETDWILHADIDHILTIEGAEALIGRALNPARWYRFRRERVGRADETRKKDDLPPTCERGPVKPHIDTYLCTRELYWRAGGYDEDFSGSLGGSAPFLAHMTKDGGDPIVLSDVLVEVHTRHSVPDASEPNLSRDRSRFERLRAELRAKGDPKPAEHVRFPWTRVV